MRRSAGRLALGLRLWLWPGLLHRAHLRFGARLRFHRLPDLLSGLRLGTRFHGLARLGLRTLRDWTPFRLGVPQRLGTGVHVHFLRRARIGCGLTLGLHAGALGCRRLHLAHLRALGGRTVWLNGPYIRLRALGRTDIGTLRTARHSLGTAQLPDVPGLRSTCERVRRGAGHSTDLSVAAVSARAVVALIPATPVRIVPIIASTTSIMAAIARTISPVPTIPTIPSVGGGVYNLAATFVVRVFADLPLARPDAQRRNIIVEPVPAEIGNALVQAERSAAFVGIRIERHCAIARPVMALQRRAFLAVIVVAIMRIGPVTGPPETIRAMT